MGTLLVFLDDGIDQDVPLLAIPINLAATLRLDGDAAFVVLSLSLPTYLGDWSVGTHTRVCWLGLHGVHGRRVAEARRARVVLLHAGEPPTACAHPPHHPLTFCHRQPPCLDEYGTEMAFDFDFNQQSMVSTASHAHDLYPIYIYPDTAPWAKRQTYFAAGQQIGLAS